LGAGYPVVLGFERDDDGAPVWEMQEPSLAHEKPKLKGGIALTLSPLRQEIKGQFEAWLLADAKKDALEWRGLVTPQEFALILAEVSAKKTAKAYSWLGPVWREVFPTEPGQRQMFYLLTRENHPDLLPDKVDELCRDFLVDVVQAVAEVVAAGNRTGHRRAFRGWPEVVREASRKTTSRRSAASS